MKEQFSNVWDAIEDISAESASMKARSEIMIALCKRIDDMGVTQAKAAKQLGITQPRLNDLLRGRINRFSLDALFDIAARTGVSVKVKLN